MVLARDEQLGRESIRAGERQNGHVVRAVESNVAIEECEVARHRLESDHPPGAAHEPRAEQSVEADVGADVEEDLPGVQQVRQASALFHFLQPKMHGNAPGFARSRTEDIPTPAQRTTHHGIGQLGQ